jgi:photosystem II stability/assembly factor-like uncharacterized protein
VIWDLTLASEPTPRIFAASSTRSVLLSTDGGASWQETGPASDVRALAVDSAGTVYAGVPSSGVFKSTDGAATWLPARGGLGVRPIVHALMVDPITPARIYAATFDGMFRTETGGISWVRTSEGLPGKGGWASTLAVRPDMPETVYAGTRGGVFRSDSLGATWVSANSGLTAAVASTVAVDPHSPATVYAGLDGGGVARSVDGGRTWLSRNHGLDVPTVYGLLIDPTRPTTLYANTFHGGVFQSVDSGDRWSELGNGLSSDPSNYPAVLGVAPTTPSTIYARTSLDGLLKSTDDGATWQLAREGLPDGFVIALAIDPSDARKLYASVTPRDSIVLDLYRSIDGASSWRRVAAMPRGIGAITIDPLRPTVLYATGREEFFSAALLFTSTDGGETWTRLGASLPLAGFAKLALDPLVPTTLYLTADVGRPYVSSDAGRTWSPLDDDGLVGFMESLAIAPDARTLFVGTEGYGVFRFEIVPTTTTTTVAGTTTSTLATPTSTLATTSSMSTSTTSTTLPLLLGDLLIRLSAELPDPATAVGKARRVAKRLARREQRAAKWIAAGIETSGNEQRTHYARAGRQLNKLLKLARKAETKEWLGVPLTPLEETVGAVLTRLAS